MFLVVVGIALAGSLIYWRAKSEKLERIGELLFACSLFACLLWLVFSGIEFHSLVPFLRR